METLRERPLSGPDFINTDFSVIKHFPVKENLRIDFRAEFFNLFNHAQFGMPGADVNSPPPLALSRSTVNNPRVMPVRSEGQRSEASEHCPW